LEQQGKTGGKLGKNEDFEVFSLVSSSCSYSISWEALLLQFLIIEQRSMSHQGKSTTATPDAFVRGKGGRGRGGGGGGSRPQSLNKQQKQYAEMDLFFLLFPLHLRQLAHLLASMMISEHSLPLQAPDPAREHHWRSARHQNDQCVPI
jgi:hypothetical protein